MTIERVNYFDGQFLKEGDFSTEQKYHLEARRRLLFMLFEKPGVVSFAGGLELDVDKLAKTFHVKKGIAISLQAEVLQGREIVVEEEMGPFPLHATSTTSRVALSVDDVPSQQPPSEGDVLDDTRIVEVPTIEVLGDGALLREGQVLLGAIPRASMDPDYTDQHRAQLRTSLFPVARLPQILLDFIPEDPLAQDAAAPGKSVTVIGLGLDQSLKLVLRRANSPDIPLSIDSATPTELKFKVPLSGVPLAQDYFITIVKGPNVPSDVTLRKRLFVDVLPTFDANPFEGTLPVPAGQTPPPLFKIKGRGLTTVTSIIFEGQGSSPALLPFPCLDEGLDGPVRISRKDSEVQMFVKPVVNQPASATAFGYFVRVKTRLGDLRTGNPPLQVRF